MVADPPVLVARVHLEDEVQQHRVSLVLVDVLGHGGHLLEGLHLDRVDLLGQEEVEHGLEVRFEALLVVYFAELAEDARDGSPDHRRVLFAELLDHGLEARVLVEGQVSEAGGDEGGARDLGGVVVPHDQALDHLVEVVGEELLGLPDRQLLRALDSGFADVRLFDGADELERVQENVHELHASDVVCLGGGYL